jgi:hypothetical protein
MKKITLEPGHITAMYSILNSVNPAGLFNIVKELLHFYDDLVYSNACKLVTVNNNAGYLATYETRYRFKKYYNAVTLEEAIAKYEFENKPYVKVPRGLIREPETVV